jgi:hypothetical protein
MQYSYSHFKLVTDFPTQSVQEHLTMGHVTVQLSAVSLEDLALAPVQQDMEFVAFVSLFTYEIYYNLVKKWRCEK